MTAKEWLSEDERQMLEGHLWYSHAQIYAREFASRLAAERERNAELVEALDMLNARFCSYLNFPGGVALNLDVLDTVKTALAKNGGKP